MLANAGATRPKRDAVDERVIEMVRTGKVTTQAGDRHCRRCCARSITRRSVIREITELVEKGIITDISQVGGYPEYRGEPYADADSDGMPDDWETKYGLDPNDAADAAGDLNGDGYTNIEDFLQRPRSDGAEEGMAGAADLQGSCSRSDRNREACDPSSSVVVSIRRRHGGASSWPGSSRRNSATG